MKIRVDDSRCQGHTLCAAQAPEIFRLSADNGHAYVETEEVPDTLATKVRAASIGCPEQAIIVEP